MTLGPVLYSVNRVISEVKQAGLHVGPGLLQAFDSIKTLVISDPKKPLKGEAK
jgi:hypothetical protein